MRKYSLKEDHARLKAQIKEWERQIDAIIAIRQADLFSNDDTDQVLENLSQEMMAVNL